MRQHNIDMNIIDSMIPLFNNPIAERIMRNYNINKNELVNDLQALRDNRVDNTLTFGNSAMFKELDQF